MIFFFPKKLISWTAIDFGICQKRDFDPPLLSKLRGGGGVKIWLRGYFGTKNLSFEWVPYTIIRIDSFI